MNRFEIPPTRHLHALTIALLIAAQQKFHAELEHAVSDVLEKATEIAGYSDERKADLYALIAESLDGSETMIMLEQKINTCLWKNEAKNWS